MMLNRFFTASFKTTGKLPQLSSLNVIRCYHPISTEYDNSEAVLEPLTYKMDSVQSKILSHCIKEKVPHYGFTEKALVSSIDLGYDSTMLNIIGSPNSPSIFHSSPATMELLKYNLVTKRYSLIAPDIRGGLVNKSDTPSLETLTYFLYRKKVPPEPSSNFNMYWKYTDRLAHSLKFNGMLNLYFQKRLTQKLRNNYTKEVKSATKNINV